MGIGAEWAVGMAGWRSSGDFGVDGFGVGGFGVGGLGVVVLGWCLVLRLMELRLCEGFGCLMCCA